MNWLDGKKTVIGSLLTQVALWGPQVLCSDGPCDPVWLDMVFQMVAILGSAMTGVGVVHKVRKGDLKGK